MHAAHVYMQAPPTRGMDFFATDLCCGCRPSAGKPTAKHNGYNKVPSVQCGIGVVFRCEMEGSIPTLAVDRIIPGGPAASTDEKPGLQPGDVLESIDGKNVLGWRLSEIAPALLGLEGSEIVIGVRRDVSVDAGIPGASVIRSLSFPLRRQRTTPPPDLEQAVSSSPGRVPLPPKASLRKGVQRSGFPTGNGKENIMVPGMNECV